MCVCVCDVCVVGESSLGSIVEGSRARAILVLRECIWNAPVISLVLPAFDDTESLGSPHQVVSLPGSTLSDCLPFTCGEYGD